MLKTDQGVRSVDLAAVLSPNLVDACAANMEGNAFHTTQMFLGQNFALDILYVIRLVDEGGRSFIFPLCEIQATPVSATLKQSLPYNCCGYVDNYSADGNIASSSSASSAVLRLNLASVNVPAKDSLIIELHSDVPLIENGLQKETFSKIRLGKDDISRLAANPVVAASLGSYGDQMERVVVRCYAKNKSEQSRTLVASTSSALHQKICNNPIIIR
jgi:hypothetical protein